MAGKSPKNRGELLARVGQAVQLNQEATDIFDDVAARALGLNRTDLKCLNAISKGEGVQPSEVAAATFLTRGATTTALDRLEKAGYIERVRDGADRRTVRLRMTKEALKKVMAIWAPMAEEGGKLMAHKTEKELEIVLEFLEEGRRIQLEQAEKLRKKLESQGRK